MDDIQRYENVGLYVIEEMLCYLWIVFNHQPLETSEEKVEMYC